MNKITQTKKLHNWVVYGHGGEIGIVLVALFFMAAGIISWILFSGILLSATLIYFNIGRPKGAGNK